MTLDIRFSGKKQISKVYFEQGFLKKKFNQFKEIIQSEETGFFHVNQNQSLVDECRNIYKKFQHKRNFIHIGIGGSSLGPEMLIKSLKKNDRHFIFINNIDPEEIHDQLSKILIQDSLFYFCSKSGGTAETLASLAILTNFLQEKGINKEQLKNYFVFATDPKKSSLLELAKELDISYLTIPSNIGGRFTVLTPVGFLPALFANLDIDLLNQGAENIKIKLLNEDLKNNILLQFASFLFTFKKEKKISQTVFMPYSSKLKSFSNWFVQLWAESLGKKKNLKGEVVHTGFTPIPSYGATDQHSQVQLFMEGPFEKVIIFLEVEHFENDYSLRNDFTQEGLQKLSGFTLAQLLRAELYGTLEALKENQRPYIHIKIKENNEHSMGELILFFESLTALMGCYLEINPFDQPGVEIGKKYAFKFLNA